MPSQETALRGRVCFHEVNTSSSATEITSAHAPVLDWESDTEQTHAHTHTLWQKTAFTPRLNRRRGSVLEETFTWWVFSPCCVWLGCSVSWHDWDQDARCFLSAGSHRSAKHIKIVPKVADTTRNPGRERLNTSCSSFLLEAEFTECRFLQSTSAPLYLYIS